MQQLYLLTFILLCNHVYMCVSLCLEALDIPAAGVSESCTLPDLELNVGLGSFAIAGGALSHFQSESGKRSSYPETDTHLNPSILTL